MTQHQPQPEQKNFGGILKNILLILIILQFVPLIISTFKSQLTEYLNPKTNVGFLTIKGAIVDSTYYVKEIRKFLKDSSIKALLLRIDSPGGFQGAPQAIFNELKKFKDKKPVVSLVENVCASGAYYVAAASSKIITNPSSLVGSIGSYFPLTMLKDLAQTLHIKFQYIQSGKYKTVGSPWKDSTPEELEMLQNVSNDIYEQFTKDISQARGIKIEERDKWADGRIFTATQAIDLNLVDLIGSFSDAEDLLKKLITERGITVEEEIRFIQPKKPSKLSQLLSGDGEDDDFASSTATFISNVITQCSKQLTV